MRGYIQKLKLLFKNMMQPKSNEKPILVVFGATGAGKSKLAIDIATRLNGEIVSADSMQVYKGLDIITNKVTNAEQALCRHYMIGFVEPLQEFNVHQFQQEATRIIKDIHSRCKLPIIVGGTNYYIQSLLWNQLVRERKLDDDEKLREHLNSLTAEELYRELETLDPEYAQKLHPQDTRKIIRSLEIYHRTNKKHSEFIKDQQLENKARGSSLKYRNICGIVVGCDPDVLNERIAKRVDKMMNAGLIAELEQFHADYNKLRFEQGLNADYEHGIFQSIGFKEFHYYLTANNLPDCEREKVKNTAIERMKLSTWQYAKYQKKWIKKRVVDNQDSLVVFEVDASNPESWDDKVLLPSLKALRKNLSWHGIDGVNENIAVFKNLDNISMPKLMEKDQAKKLPRKFVKNTCKICNNQPVFIVEETWLQHLQSRRHKLALKHQSKLKLQATRELSKTLDRLIEQTEKKY